MPSHTYAEHVQYVQYLRPDVLTEKILSRVPCMTPTRAAPPAQQRTWPRLAGSMFLL